MAKTDTATAKPALAKVTPAIGFKFESPSNAEIVVSMTDNDNDDIWIEQGGDYIYIADRDLHMFIDALQEVADALPVA